MGLLLAACLLPALLLGSRPPPPQPSEPLLRIAFVGDVLLEAPWQQPPLSPADMLADIRLPLARGDFDLVVCNLEEPLTDSPHRTPHKNRAAVAAGRDFILRAASPDAARALREAGIQVAALANNHTMDYTERGLLDTIESLEAAGILPVGAGENLEAAEQVRVVEIRGVRVGFLSFSDIVPLYFWAEEDRPGIASSKYLEHLQAVIARARPQADLLVVIFHWGKMFTPEPNARQRELARAAQQAGADLILGAHPHVLQGVGCLGHVPVVYSAGNFVFPTRHPARRRSAIFEIEFSRPHTASVRVVPVLLDAEGRPHLAEGEAARSILEEMERLSSQLGARFSGDTTTCPASPPAEAQATQADPGG